MPAKAAANIYANLLAQLAALEAMPDEPEWVKVYQFTNGISLRDGPDGRPVACNLARARRFDEGDTDYHDVRNLKGEMAWIISVNNARDHDIHRLRQYCELIRKEAA